MPLKTCIVRPLGDELSTIFSKKRSEVSVSESSRRGRHSTHKYLFCLIELMYLLKLQGIGYIANRRALEELRDELMKSIGAVADQANSVAENAGKTARAVGELQYFSTIVSYCQQYFTFTRSSTLTRFVSATRQK